MDDLVEVASVGDLEDRGCMVVEAFGHRIALFRLGEEHLAIGARCPHAGGPLEDGYVKEGVVTCPWHSSRFDLASGEVLGGPSPKPVPVFPLRVLDGKILLGPPPAGTDAPAPTMF